jgi:RNA polymerase sigma factor (sigma-70 family)
MEEESDESLYERWRGAGDRNAGDRLVRRHHGEIFKLVKNRVRVPDKLEDVVQDIFTALSASKFRGDSSFRTFLFAIMRRKIIDSWQRRFPQPIDPNEVTILSMSTSIGTRMVRAENRAKLQSCLDALPIADTIRLVYYYWYGFDRIQLAQMEGVEPATIGSRLHRSRIELRKLILASEGDSSPGLLTEEALEEWAARRFKDSQ